MTDPLESLELFLGATSPTVARIFARLGGRLDLEQLDNAASLRLSGHLYGPLCSLAKTLPARIPFRDLGRLKPGDPLLAQALLPDPCFWSTEMPITYRAVLELRHGDSLLARQERDYGMQTLGVDGRQMYCQSKRWVLRGVGQASADDVPLAEWRDAFSALVVPHPDDALCAAASQAGVFLVAVVADSARDPLAEIRRLAQFAAVGIAIVEGDVVAALKSRGVANAELRAAACDLLLAERLPCFVGAEPTEPTELASWAQLAVCDAADVAAFSRLAKEMTRPVIACRALPARQPPASARAACDRLQSDLVHVGDFAGYIV